ncbi:hypothetical protein Tco_1196865 [Tanacetum coccineum]
MLQRYLSELVMLTCTPVLRTPGDTDSKLLLLGDPVSDPTNISLGLAGFSHLRHASSCLFCCVLGLDVPPHVLYLLATVWFLATNLLSCVFPKSTVYSFRSSAEAEFRVLPMQWAETCYLDLTTRIRIHL